MPYKKGRRKFSYKSARYWYHISTTLKDKHIQLIPWDEESATNRDPYEPSGKRICVAPTIEQCITALPYWLHETYIIYRTKSTIRAHRPRGVFDSRVTHEGWLKTPTSFIKIGILKLGNVEKTLNKNECIIEEAASGNDAVYSGEVLKWWRKLKIRRFIKRA